MAPSVCCHLSPRCGCIRLSVSSLPVCSTLSMRYSNSVKDMPWLVVDELYVCVAQLHLYSQRQHTNSLWVVPPVVKSPAACLQEEAALTVFQLITYPYVTEHHTCGRQLSCKPGEMAWVHGTHAQPDLCVLDSTKGVWCAFGGCEACACFQYTCYMACVCACCALCL